MHDNPFIKLSCATFNLSKRRSNKPLEFCFVFCLGFYWKDNCYFFSVIKIMFSIDNLTIESAFFIL